MARATPDQLVILPSFCRYCLPASATPLTSACVVGSVMFADAQPPMPAAAAVMAKLLLWRKVTEQLGVREWRP